MRAQIQRKTLLRVASHALLCIFILLGIGSLEKGDRHGRALTYASAPIVLAVVHLLGSSLWRVWPTTAFPFSSDGTTPPRNQPAGYRISRGHSVSLVGSAGRVQSDQASLSAVTAAEQEVRTQNGFHGHIVGWGCITPEHRAPGKLFIVESDLRFLHNSCSS